MKTLLGILGAVLLGKELLGADAWITRETVKERDAFASMNLFRNGKEPITVLLSNPADNSGIELVLPSGGKTTHKIQPAGAFASMAGRITTFPCPVFGAVTTFTLKRTEEVWIAYADNEPIARFPELWTGEVQLRHAPQAKPNKDADSFVQKLGSFRFDDNFLVPAGSAFPETWEKISGVWGLHSVTGSISGVSGGYKLRRMPLPEKSPNFYTMEGSGTNAVLLAGEPFYSRYSFCAAVQHNVGTNGIVFLAPEQGGYFAFTAENRPDKDGIVLVLWRRPAAPQASPVRLAAVQTELTQGQWLLLEARVLDDRIVCLADHNEVIRHKISLPPGGRFGLFANTPPGDVTRFDDVSASSREDFLFDSPEDIASFTRPPEKGQTLPQPKTDGKRVFLTFTPNVTNLWRYGADSLPPLRAEVTFQADGPVFFAALEAGGEGRTAPRNRFSCNQANGTRLYTLEQIATNGQVRILDRFSTPSSSNSVTLALDAVRPHQLRCTADGRLVCFDRPSKQPGGILGIVGRAPGILSCTAPLLSQNDSPLRDRFEKNKLYVNDPFMRHWSSPEGQWVTFKDGLTWFKGDLTGATEIRLPAVPGMILHLHIPEGSSAGQCRVAVDKNAIHVFTSAGATNAAFSVPLARVSEVKVEKRVSRLYTLGISGNTVWLGTDTALLEKAHIPQAFTGRRMRVQGMTLDTLAQTLVTRDNVFDTLFNESLYNWTINGGKWEVINRFFCEPTWSHMNGESEDSLAALWSKYIFHGDFSIEFYAGQRMGWYQRAGDLNLTVMSRNNSAKYGYTAIATGWDPDHSQLYSRLLSNGRQLALTDRYLVPRVRSGNVRHGYQPLINAGRSIHGAWYAMQLRRTAGRLYYNYDNEPVFNVKDEEPMNDGSLGIWTYQNSMMVARIKIAAESIHPRPFAFHAIPVTETVVPKEAIPSDSGVRANGRVLRCLLPQYWEADDTVSHPSVRFSGLSGTNTEMRVTSTLGAGSFLVRCKLPPSESDKLLGWQFEMMQSPDTCVNALFETVRENKKTGVLSPVQKWSYVISGTDESRGDRLIAGVCRDIPTNGWKTIRVWLPSFAIRSKLPVRFVGFGNLQSSEVQMGLRGNPKGAWYAVRNFSELHCGLPELSAPPDRRAQLGGVLQAMRALPVGTLNEVALSAALDPGCPDIVWAIPELASFGLRIKADASVRDTLLVTPAHPWPSPLLPPCQVIADGKVTPFTMEGDNVRILLPHGELPAGRRITVSLELADKRIFKQIVPLDIPGEANLPPVLLGLSMPEGGIETFEQRPYVITPHAVKLSLTELKYRDSERGTVLAWGNKGRIDSRLPGQLVKVFDPVATPLLQFRYKGDPMANVSFAFGDLGFSFSESYNLSVRQPGVSSIAMDNRWHIWTGYPTDATGKHPLSKRTKIVPTYIQLLSHGRVNQTGLHSELAVDDIACGPATGPNRPFAFKADYADRDGVANVEYALARGTLAYDLLPEKARTALTWITCANETVVQPDISKLQDGVHHLLVRARDKKGLLSVPADIPFILDRKPPEVSAKIESTKDYNGSRLRLTVLDAFSPPVMGTISLSCLGRELPLSKDNGYVLFTREKLEYEIDWIWSLQEEIRKAKDGSILSVHVSGITDAAGNGAPALKIDIPLSFKTDRRAPAVFPLPTPANALVFFPQFNTEDSFFSDSSGVKISTVGTAEGNVMDVLLEKKSEGKLQSRFPGNWDPDTYPWLALSFRKVGITNNVMPFDLHFYTGQRRPRGVKDTHIFSWGKANGLAYVTGKITPNGEEWQDVLINVHDFLRDETAEKKNTPNITYITLPIHPKMSGGHIQIRALAVFAPWKANDCLSFRAYDLTGIKGMLWKNGFSKETVIHPGQLQLPKEDPHWFRFRISDGAGNLTGTWMIPVVKEKGK